MRDMNTAKNGTFAAVNNAPAPRPVLTALAFNASPPLFPMSIPAAFSNPRDTGSMVSANLLNGFTVTRPSARVLAAPAGKFSVTSSATASPYKPYPVNRHDVSRYCLIRSLIKMNSPAPPMSRHVSPTIAYVLFSIPSYSSGCAMLV